MLNRWQPADENQIKKTRNCQLMRHNRSLGNRYGGVGSLTSINRSEAPSPVTKSELKKEFSDEGMNMQSKCAYEPCRIIFYSKPARYGPEGERFCTAEHYLYYSLDRFAMSDASERHAWLKSLNEKDRQAIAVALLPDFGPEQIRKLMKDAGFGD
jgi:hypothetical protein